MTIDVSPLWDFENPELSEKRFLSALSGASAEDVLVLQTQIARTYGIRGDFDKAREILSGIAPQIQSANLETKVRYSLELGRTYSSATHPPETQTMDARDKARSAFLTAFDLAQKASLDNLAIDALHMMTFVDTEPKDQVEWNAKAIAFMQASTQPDAKKWEGSLRNNLGYALYLMENYEEALSEFRLALAAHELGGNPQAIRIAYWMVAWTLRAMGKVNDALEIQLRLEKECDEAGEPDPYVFEELELLYKAMNDGAKAEFYADRLKKVG